MSSNAIDAERIGPRLDLADLQFPPAVAERLATLYGRDAPVADGAEWVAATRGALDGSVGGPPTVEDLCTTPDGAHAFEGDGESQAYVCVLDPLAYPFLTDTPGTVRSETPVRGEAVTVEVSGSGATATPESAVVSIGVAEGVDAVETVTPEVVYRQVCGYIHAFEDESEYETWAGTVDAATTSVPVETGVAVAGQLATELFG